MSAMELITVCYWYRLSGCLSWGDFTSGKLSRGRHSPFGSFFTPTSTLVFSYNGLLFSAILYQLASPKAWRQGSPEILRLRCKGAIGSEALLAKLDNSQLEHSADPSAYPNSRHYARHAGDRACQPRVVTACICVSSSFCSSHIVVPALCGTHLCSPWKVHASLEEETTRGVVDMT